jgi:hypothetical protein
MTIKTSKRLDINLEGEEVTDLQSALKKVIDNCKKVGFHQIGLTKNEEQVIIDISEKINV